MGVALRRMRACQPVKEANCLPDPHSRCVGRASKDCEWTRNGRLHAASNDLPRLLPKARGVQVASYTGKEQFKMNCAPIAALQPSINPICSCTSSPGCAQHAEQVC